MNRRTNAAIAVSLAGIALVAATASASTEPPPITLAAETSVAAAPCSNPPTEAGTSPTSIAASLPPSSAPDPTATATPAAGSTDASSPPSSAAPSTDTPSSLTPSTTAPPTTLATITTEVPLTPEETAPAQASADMILVGDWALGNPEAPDVAERLDAVYADGAPARRVIEENIEFVLGNGWRVRQNPDNPRQFTVEQVTLWEEAGLRCAEVVACVVDTSITYEPGGAPDGSDAIVNDDFASSRGSYQLTIEDDQWQVLEAFDLTGLQFGETECPPA